MVACLISEALDELLVGAEMSTGMHRAVLRSLHLILGNEARDRAKYAPVVVIGGRCSRSAERMAERDGHDQCERRQSGRHESEARPPDAMSDAYNLYVVTFHLRQPLTEFRNNTIKPDVNPRRS